MFTRVLTSVVLFLSVLGATAQSHTIPTLDRNNTWTGTNTFTYGNLHLSLAGQCPAGSYMTGYTTAFAPVCQVGSGASGVASINGTGGTITLANGTNISIVQSPTGTFTINSTGGGGGGVTSLNGLAGAITFTAGAGISLTQTSSTNITIGNTGGGGGGGSGTVGIGSPYQNVQYNPSSTTTVQPNPTWYSVNNAMTLSQINTLISSLNGGAYFTTPQGGVATITVPDGVLPQGWTNSTSELTGGGNAGVGFNDIRSGARTEPLSRWGVTCNASQQGSYIFTTGSNQVSPYFTAFSAGDVGSTIVVVMTIGGVPTRFMPIITAVNTGTGVATISTTAPASGTFAGTKGFNNQGALQNAMLGLRIANEVGQFPAGCAVLTDTFQYRGPDNLVGDAQYSTVIYGVPGADILQNPDGGAITAFSITSNVVTMTGANEFIPGQVVTPRNLTTGTYLNGVGFTVSATGLSNTSYQLSTPNFTHANVTNTTDSGYSAPESVGGSAVVLRNIKFVIDNSIDATKPWNSIDSNGVTVNHPGVYRPLADNSAIANDPLAPAWAANATNGVADTTQNSAVICVPTALGRLPSVTGGNQIVFPNLPTVYKGTVTALSGAGCLTGYQGVTVSPALPNVLGNTVTQTEWISTTQINSLTTAMTAGTITYPLTIHVSNASNTIPGWPMNIATHGGVKIGNEEYIYIGGSFSATGATLVLRGGPTSTVGWAIGTAVVPQNPCPVARELPWPVLPNLNTGDATPHGAMYFPGLCVGNAGLAMAELNSNVYTGNGYAEADIEDISFVTTNSNAINHAAGYYIGGNNASYSTTYKNIQSVGPTYGIAQGSSSYGNHGWKAVGPTADGNHYTNLHLAGAYNWIFDDLQDSTIDRVDAYTTGWNDFDSTAIGSVTAFIMGYTVDEQTGNTVSNTSANSVDSNNSEPENGSHIEVPPYAVLNCYTCTYNNNIFEGIPTILGGGYQTINGGQLGTESINYGLSNVVKYATGASGGNLSPGLQFPSILNYGLEFNSSVPMGQQGPLVWAAPFSRASSDGQNDQFAYMGNSTPFVDSKAGMIWSDELTTNAGLEANAMDSVGVYDATAAVSGNYASCNLITRTSCNSTHIDGNNLMYVGPSNRIPADLTTLQMMVKGSAAENTNLISVAIGADDDGTGSCQNPTASVARVNINFTTSWAIQEFPVDFSTHSGCAINIQIIGGAASIITYFQYFDFIPMPSRVLLRTSTSTSGAACSVNGTFLGSDATNLYMCESGTVHLLPFGGGGSALTMNNSGSGATSGTTYSGASPVTISYNTIGASPLASPTFTGTVTIPALTLSTITGSSQCLQANSAGVVTGSGSTCNPMTSVGDMIYGGTSGAETRVAGSSVTQIAALTQTGTGTASAAPVWVPGTGTGAPVFATSPALVTPSFSGGMTGDTITLSGPATGIAGLGGQFYTLGATAQVGTSPTAAACITNVVCDSMWGTFSFATGTGSLTAGTIVTVTLPGTRTNIPSCWVNGHGGSIVPGWYATASISTGTITVTISSTVALAASTTYTLVLGCGGV